MVSFWLPPVVEVYLCQSDVTPFQFVSLMTDVPYSRKRCLVFFCRMAPRRRTSVSPSKKITFNWYIKKKNCKKFLGNATVTHLKFIVPETADSLIVAANSDNGGFIEIWELMEKTQSIHKVFQPKTMDNFKTVVRQYSVIIGWWISSKNANNFFRFGSIKLCITVRVL